MEKLIELLNEYEKSKTHIDYTWKIEDKSEKRMCWVEYTWAYVNEEEMERIVISKKYMFIKRLVDNDKIDFDKCWYCYEINSTYDHYNLEDSQDLWLIMLLSISSSPIEDLVSYLK